MFFFEPPRSVMQDCRSMTYLEQSPLGESLVDMKHPPPVSLRMAVSGGAFGADPKPKEENTL